MEATINKAIKLRKNGQYQGSREVLQPLLDNEEYQTKVHLHMAWSYDNEGKEEEAIKYYHAALAGLDPESGLETERFETLFGLGCTYRSLGQYDEALIYFELTLAEYPDAMAVKPFYAMCLYNLDRAKEATALLLEVLVSTTDSDDIKAYEKAILNYSKDLDRTG